MVDASEKTAAKRKLKKLTTTSCVLLGYLSARSWSAYDLINFQRRSSAGEFFPRAESHIYDELKNLAAHGLVEVETERHGKRARSVYTINDRGRVHLRQWLSEPGTSRTLEWDQMLKIYFSDFGTKEDLLAHIRSVREDMLARLRFMLDMIGEADLPSVLILPDRWYMATLVGNYTTREAEMIIEWSEWAEKIVLEWPDTKHSEQADSFAHNTSLLHIKKARELVGRYGKAVD